MYTENITVNGIAYKMIDEAEIHQELLPGHRESTAYGSWFCVKADDQPDEIGAVKLYEFKYVLMDAEDYENGSEWYDNVDWEAPDDIVEAPYMWLEAEQRMV
jgi:hypothetical protein